MSRLYFIYTAKILKTMKYDRFIQYKVMIVIKKMVLTRKRKQELLPATCPYTRPMKPGPERRHVCEGVLGNFLSNHATEYSATSTHLSSGSVGEVYTVHPRGGKVARVAKIVLVSSDDELRLFDHEMRMHLDFMLKLPERTTTLYHWETGCYQGQNFGVCISEQLDFNMRLDRVLENMNDDDERLPVIANELVQLHVEMMGQRICHGDTALFNFFWSRGGTLKMIDFDRSHTLSPKQLLMFGKLDVLRTYTEFYNDTRSISQDGRTIFSSHINTTFRNAFINSFGKMYKDKTNNEWVEVFTKYCKFFKVRCLEW